MAIKAVVFDIGGVLEITPNLGVNEKWEQIFNLKPGEFDQKLIAVWRGGSWGTMTEAEVYQNIREIIGMSEAQLQEFIADLWREYLGTPNTELIEYFRGLRGRYKTGIISNSFVGAREREQALYGFEDMTDVIVYSHEVGISKPTPRIYEMAWERLGVQPDEMIFLDDREGAIEAANALGIHGIVFKENGQAIAEIEACLKANS